MPRTWIRPVLALVLVATASICAAPSTASAQGVNQTACPSTFDVLHDDSIGRLQLAAGSYTITVLNASTLTCTDASELFREFLEDYDGRLAGGWRVDPASATFTRGGLGFRVAPSTTPPTPPTPPSDRVCPSYFTVLHDDHIGSFAIRKGRYRITLLSVGRISCAQAATYLARFLDDFDGILPRPWLVDPSTGSFMRGSRYIGFRIKPWSGDFPPGSGGGGRHPTNGSRCPATFRVQHNDRIGKLKLPRGAYTVTVRGSITCSQASTLFARFLDTPSGVLPRPWQLTTTSGSFSQGPGSANGFRVKPTR